MHLARSHRGALETLLGGYGLQVQWLAADAHIPGSWWGGSEAGLRGSMLFARPDTPLHSVLHEAAHYLCMSEDRRARLDRDAGGDDAEEEAVCYLQVLMTDALPGVERAALLQDMDAWGYSFRLGSAAAWFARDAAQARAWLVRHGLIDAAAILTGTLRLSGQPANSGHLVRLVGR
jgi:hypothetical protein